MNITQKSILSQLYKNGDTVICGECRENMIGHTSIMDKACAIQMERTQRNGKN